MREERVAIKKLIESLKEIPGKEPSKISTQVEVLHQLLSIPTFHRLLRLRGINPSFDFLLPKLDTELEQESHDVEPAIASADFPNLVEVQPLSAAEGRVTRSRKLLQTIRNKIQLKRLKKFTTSRKSKKESAREHSSIATSPVLGDNPQPLELTMPEATTADERLSSGKPLQVPGQPQKSTSSPPLLGSLTIAERPESETQESQGSSAAFHQHKPMVTTDSSVIAQQAEIPNSPSNGKPTDLGSIPVEAPVTKVSGERDLPATEPVLPDQESTSEKSLMSLKEFLIGRGIPLGDLEIHSERKAILDGDEFEYMNNLIVEEKVKAWKSLETTLIEFQSLELLPDPTESGFQLEFLRVLFLTGDYIYKYGLLPSEFIESIRIFKPDLLMDMLKFHIDLMFLRWGESFFGKSETVIPQLEFLTTGLRVKQFHRSIKGESAFITYRHRKPSFAVLPPS
jgi:hypothetical protein